MGAGRQRRHIWRFLKQVFGEYIRDNCPLMAAAISFYVLLSLIPLSLVGLSAFGYVLGSERAFQAISHFLGQFVPEAFGGAALRAYLKDSFYHPRGIVGLLGLLGLLWTGSVSFATITRALNIAWEVQEHRGYLALRLRAMAMTLVVGLLVLLSFGTTQAIRIIREYRIPWLGFQPGEIPLVWQVVGWCVPVALSLLVFLLCYVALPDRRIGWRPALLGAVVAGILWEATKQGFALYIANFGNYNKVYGSLGGLVILVMWVYYSAVILLVGGEVAGVRAEWGAASGKSERRGTKR